MHCISGFDKAFAAACCSHQPVLMMDVIVMLMGIVTTLIVEVTVLLMVMVVLTVVAVVTVCVGSHDDDDDDDKDSSRLSTLKIVNWFSFSFSIKDKRSYSCPVCEKSFSEDRLIKTHIKTNHPGKSMNFRKED